MPARPDTRETVLLALALLKRIPRTRKVTARELQEQLPPELARDIRTVQRQLDMLAREFDIERDESGRPYGYRWKEFGAGLSLPSLTEQESLLLTLAEEHLRNLLPASLMRSMDGFFDQARRRAALDRLAKRVVDLLPIVEANYYHPIQEGSWSIKKVLPAMVPELRYDQLDGIQDGGAAMEAYLEATNPDTTPERKAEIERQLQAYCGLDTYAMVKLWQVLAGRQKLKL